MLISKIYISHERQERRDKVLIRVIGKEQNTKDSRNENVHERSWTDLKKSIVHDLGP